MKRTWNRWLCVGLVIAFWQVVTHGQSAAPATGDSKPAEAADPEAQLIRRARSIREWDTRATTPVTLRIDAPDEPSLARLRSYYGLEKLVAGAPTQLEKLERILHWTHRQWSHAGGNSPSAPDPCTILKEAAAGNRFRCVEYAIVTAAAARAVGLPSRVLNLKREDVETQASGAGHVVAEVWLDQFKKWAMVDAQWDALPQTNGVPLNAVEFQDAIARNDPALAIISSTDLGRQQYVDWIAPYLFYLDYNLDQRFSGDNNSNEQRFAPRAGKLMLVPKGAKEPKIFQRVIPLKNCTYTSNPQTFYAPLAN